MLEYFAILFVVVGIFFGWLLAKKIPEELKDGERYFKLFEIIILVILCLFLLKDFVWYLFLIGLLVSYFIRKEYLYFGLIDINSFLLSLIFLYSLPFATLRFKSKELFWSGLFVISFILLFIEFSFNSLALGGLIGCLFYKVRFK